MNDDYISNLENVIKQMLRPLRNIPLNLVIESLSGCRITPFDRKDEKDQAVLSTLVKVAKLAGSNVNEKGIARPRPNEVGNDIEPFVKDALEQLGCVADTPLTIRGKRKTTGYPDIEFIDEFGRPNYLECKTYNRLVVK